MFDLIRDRMPSFLQNRRSSPRRRCFGKRTIHAVEKLEDRALLTVDTLSVSTAGTTGDGMSEDPHISRDGRFVAFHSRADDLALASGTDGNGFQDVFVRDLDAGTTTLISINPAGGAGDHDSWSPSISDNGRFVAFVSFATDLDDKVTVVAGPNVFVHDRDTDRNGVYDEPGGTSVRMLSVNRLMPGFSGDGPSGGLTVGETWSFRPVISGNGRYVAYVSGASTLLDPDDGVTVLPGGAGNLYVSPTTGGETRLVSVDQTGTTSGAVFGGGTATIPSISADGRYIAFNSDFENLTGGDDEGLDDVFVRDIFKGATTRVSVAPDGAGGNLHSREPVLSRNGRHVVFTSAADNLVPGDTNGHDDIFVYDLSTARLTLVSASRDPAATSVSGNDASPVDGTVVEAGYDISDNGRYVLFTSLASDLLDPADGVVDTNGTTDVFLFDRDADGDGIFDETVPGATRTTPVSINAAGTDLADASIVSGGSSAVSISGDGRFAVFTSPGTNLVAGTATDTGVYVRDLMAGSTEFIALTGELGALRAGVAESGVATAPLRVAFSSVEPGIDPAVPDTNGIESDAYVYDAPIDIRFTGAKGDGNERLLISYSIDNAPADGPFELGIYRSDDGDFDAGVDELLDTVTISGSDLDVGPHGLVFDIGDGPGEIALPGAGATETDDDYQILFVLDHLDVQPELDTDPFNDDNTGRFESVYHPPGGPVFIHGRTGPVFENDRLTVTEIDASMLEVRLNRAIWTYDPADVTSIRFRGHEGKDTAQAAGAADLLHGGPGNDELRGGAGDDTIDGGPDNDVLFGEEGFDTIFDGMGDDTIDLGPDGGVIVSTPGSDDVFTNFETDPLARLDLRLANQGTSISLESSATQNVDANGNTVRLDGVFRDFAGTPFDDTVRVAPIGGPLDPVALARILRGGDGNDRVIVDARGNPVSYDGATISVPGFGPITLDGFEDIALTNVTPWIIDDSDTTDFSHTGFGDTDPNFPQGFNGGVKFSAAGSGNSATWTFDGLVPGRYTVAATWTAGDERATDAPFSFFDGGAGAPIVGQTRVNQELEPNDFESDGLVWELLSTVTITGTELTVQLTDDANEFVIADAVMLAPISPNVFQIDDGDPGFTNGTGTRVEGDGLFGGQEVFLAGSGTTVAAWDFAGVQPPLFVPGPYRVSATWSPRAGAATDAPFTVSNGNDVVTTRVDQQQPPDDIVTDGVGWKRLGEIVLNSLADLIVTLGNGANGEVVADSIRVEPAPRIRIFDRSDLLSVILDGGTLELPETTINAQTGMATSRKTIAIQNTGIDDLVFERVTVTGSRFSRTPLEVPEPVTMSTLDWIIEFSGIDFGRETGELRIESNAGAFTVNLSANVVPDTTGPMIRFPFNITPAQDRAIHDYTIHTAPETDEEVFTEVDFADSGNVAVDPDDSSRVRIMFDERGRFENSVTVTATDIAGNSTQAGPLPVRVDLDPPDVALVPLADDVDPFNDSFFNAVAEVNVPHQVAQVEFVVNGRVVDTVNQEPYIGNIPQLDGAGPSVVEVVVLDIFGTEHRSNQLMLAPSAPLTFTSPPPIVDTHRPLISFNPAPGADRHEVFIRNRSTGEVLRNNNVIGDRFVPAMNLAEGDYRVWIREFGGPSPGIWSQSHDFGVKFPILAPTISIFNSGPFTDATPTLAIGTSPTLILGQISIGLNSDGVPVASIGGGEVFVRGMFPGRGPDQTHVVPPDVDLFELPEPLPDGPYRIWHRSVNAAGRAGSWSTPRDIVVDAPVPERLVLTGPAGVVGTNQPTITFDHSRYATRYEIFMRNTTVRGMPPIRAQNIVGLSFTPGDTLRDGTWRIWGRAFNASGETAGWSDPLDITIDQTPAPVLSSLAGTINDSTPTFAWTGVANSVRHDLWVRNLTTGEDQVIREQDLQEKSFTPPTPLADGTYRWWVRSFDAAGQRSDWSAPGTFTINTIAPRTRSLDTAFADIRSLLSEFD